MPRYFVTFGQFFVAEDKAAALADALEAQWQGTRQFGAWVEEVPDHPVAGVCVDLTATIDPSTGLKHWEGADQ